MFVYDNVRSIGQWCKGFDIEACIWGVISYVNDKGFVKNYMNALSDI